MEGINPRTPVLVGVGQLKHPIADLAESVEPIEMMLRATRLAEADTGVTLLDQVDSVRVVRGVWEYVNPAGWIAAQIGAGDAQTVGTLFGGNQNQALMNQTARDILAGNAELVLITGAENGYSAAKARKTGVTLPATETPGEPDVVFGHAQKSEHHDFEMAKGIRMAIQVYPMYENAIRHARGETMSGHLQRVSSLWSRFNDVAQRNPTAWIDYNLTAEEIATPSPTNRAVSYPYPKLMNANNAVDMGAALIVTSVGKARELGIDESRFVYPHAGVEGQDHFSASVRDNFHTSPGIRLIGETLFELAGVAAADLDYVDLYSCFPSAVQVAAMELGLGEARDLTVTGGLTFNGGPLNNYVMHSIARMAELLRENPGTTGLVTANGGNLYKHAHGIYSASPPARDFEWRNVQPQIDALPGRTCVAEHDGEVTVESYAVMYGVDGPNVAHVACLTPDGARTWVNAEDPDLMLAMTREEFCGRAGNLSAQGLQLR